MSEEQMVNLEADVSDAVADDTEATENQETNTEQTTEEKLFAGKYKSVEDLENGYKEATKKLRESKPEVPEKYELDISNFEELSGVELNLEDPRLDAMQEVFKTAGLSNEQASRIAGAFAQLEMQSMPNQEEEIKKLGADGEAIRNDVSRYLTKHKGEFSESELNEILSITATADGIRAFSKVIAGMKEKSVPTSDTPQSGRTSAEVYEEAFKLKSDPQIATNKYMQQQYEKLIQEAGALQNAGR